MKRVLFDDQSEAFDRRVGLPPGVPAKVIFALSKLARVHSKTCLVEIGVGTGEIGSGLSKKVGNYLGIDRSLPMLSTFRRRVELVQFVQADGNAPWPLPARAVDVVFGFRALHHIHRGHLLAEVERVIRGPKAYLISGKVRHDSNGVKEQMRRQLHQILRSMGLEGRGGGQGRSNWMSVFEDNGWVREPDTEVATWEIQTSPQDCLDSWSGKLGLAGLEVEEGLKRKALHELKQWALDHFGNLVDYHPEQEMIVLEAIYRGFTAKENA